MSIEIKNGSFESKPRRGDKRKRVIKGWYDCSTEIFPSTSGVDVHPMGFWDVNQSPKEGESYIALIVREDGTFEAISQKLNTRLKAHVCYELTIHLCLSPNYNSPTRRSQPIGEDEIEQFSFTNSISLRFVGSNDRCNGAELLNEIREVNDANWRKYRVQFTPTKEYKYLIIFPYYNTNMFYNGHILVDALSDIRRVACE